jgi:hypothetical protein
MQKLRIGTVGISGGGSLTRPFRDTPSPTAGPGVPAGAPANSSRVRVRPRPHRRQSSATHSPASDTPSPTAGPGVPAGAPARGAAAGAQRPRADPAGRGSPRLASAGPHPRRAGRRAAAAAAAQSPPRRLRGVRALPCRACAVRVTAVHGERGSVPLRCGGEATVAARVSTQPTDSAVLFCSRFCRARLPLLPPKRIHCRHTHHRPSAVDVHRQVSWGAWWRLCTGGRAYSHVAVCVAAAGRARRAA